MKNKLARYVPPGVNYKTELNLIAWGLIAGFLYSFTFLSNYRHRYNSLF